MPRPIRASFKLSALRHNLGVARRHAPKSKIWAVVKANAYGHGLERVAQALAAAEGYALLDLNEAVRLREAGISKPILLLEGVFQPADFALVDRYALALVVHDAEQILMLERARLSSQIALLLKLNTGMNRLGFAGAQVRAAYGRLEASGKAAAISLMTHFADADGPAGVAAQLARFSEWTAGLQGEVTLANSAAILRYPESHADWVRPGIMLYGCSPFAELSAQELGLHPVMSLTSEIVAIQELRPGDRVGYGGTFEATRPMRIGVVACGYADGYPRHAPGFSDRSTPIVVAGKRTTTVGRVSMDMFCVDLSAIPEAHVGSPVILWGEGLSADEVAASAGTVSYELLCALAARVPVVEV
ncbi:MAG: alanine racemase [Betaproteobacteria bacterium RIFCSPLOWO2_12_FULL_62_13b]|nr:MAG: alanine racemase [Betaproteobacteria bacterium RIFCSPLOWO2_12_FULL_62_13b]